MNGRAQVGLVVLALTAMAASAAIVAERRHEEERAEDAVALGAAKAQLDGAEARAWFAGAGADEVDPATFDEFPLYGASAAFQDDWGELRRAIRVRVPSADPLRSADAVLLGYGSCLEQLGTCDVGTVLVVSPSCRRPHEAIAAIAQDGSPSIGGREVLRVDAAALAAAPYPGNDRSVDVLYVGDTVVEVREGSTAGIVEQLVPLNALAEAASTGATPPAAAPASAPCADPA